MPNKSVFGEAGLSSDPPGEEGPEPFFSFWSASFTFKPSPAVTVGGSKDNNLVGYKPFWYYVVNGAKFENNWLWRKSRH